MKWEKVMVYRVARRNDGTIEPVTAASLDPSDVELLKSFLQTDRIATEALAHNGTDHYLFMYDGNAVKPYPSVLIWKFVPQQTHNTFADMTREDMKAAELAIERYLR